MKAAVTSLTQSLALELGERLVRVNCVAPDVIPTPGIGEVPVRTPLPRAGHVDDVAAAVVFLANPRLSGFVTGETLLVDGGTRAAGGWRRADDGSFTT
jgi:3-oxoacyl-[acyl-carrier protein] reductase